MDTPHSRRTNGFSIIELIIAIVLLILVGSLFWMQRRDIQTSSRDSMRKTAINAIYYNLEEVHYAASKAYPEKLTAETLKGIDAKHLKDPRGVAIGDQKSEYRYEPRECNAGTCRGYTLRADLEQEIDFVKDSRNN